MEEITKQWYWDRRNKKAYYPIKQDNNSITFVTSWHEDEVADALNGGVFVSIDGFGPDYLEGRDAGFDIFDSFRLLEEETLEQLGDK